MKVFVWYSCHPTLKICQRGRPRALMCEMLEWISWMNFPLIRDLVLRGLYLTLLRLGFFGAAHEWGGEQIGRLPKICHTYLTMMKLSTVIPYLARPLSSADMSNFLLEISRFCYIKKYMYRLHFDEKFLILLTFLESLKIVLIKKVSILMMQANMATPGLLKIKIF